jgi:hypothetical protein
VVATIKTEWRDIPGYEGRYKVSDQGQIKSSYTGRLMKPQHGGTSKYLHITLRDGKGQKSFTIHRIVAQAFIDNDDPEAKTQIDHINGVKTDNRASNLEWVTPSCNVNRALDLGLYDEAREKQSKRIRGNTYAKDAWELGKYDELKKPVVRSDGKRFPSMSDAALESGTSVSQVCDSVRTRGTRTANGYAFVLEGEDLPRTMASARSAGSRFERQVADYLSKVLGDSDIDRQIKMGRKDVGDVRGVYFRGSRVVVECKNHKRMSLSEWIGEAEKEAGNADTEYSVIVHKRRQFGGASDQYVTMTLKTFAAFIAGGFDNLENE